MSNTINVIRVTNDNRFLRIEYGYLVMASKDGADYFRFVKCGDLEITDPIPSDYWVIAKCGDYNATSSAGYATSQISGANVRQIEMYNLTRDEIRQYALLGRNFSLSFVERRDGFFDKPNRVRNDMAWFQNSERGGHAFRFVEGQSSAEWAWQITSANPETDVFFETIQSRDDWWTRDRQSFRSPFFGFEPEFQFAPEALALIEIIREKAPSCSSRKRRLLAAIEAKNEREALSVLAECREWINKSIPNWPSFGLPDAWEVALRAVTGEEVCAE